MCFLRSGYSIVMDLILYLQMCHRSWLHPIYRHMNWGTTRWSPSSCQPLTCTATSSVQKTWRSASLCGEISLWSSYLLAALIYIHIFNIVFFLLLHRNSFSLKPQFLMFCPISSITPTKLSAWLLWRYGQDTNTFFLLHFQFLSSDKLLFIHDSGVCAQRLHRLWAE